MDKLILLYDKLFKLMADEVEIDGKKYLLKEEFDKFRSGNKTAATRIRKLMQSIRQVTTEIRVEVQNRRKNK